MIFNYLEAGPESGLSGVRDDITFRESAVYCESDALSWGSP